MGKTLGTGNFATVKHATCKRTGTQWAVKCIEKQNLTTEDSDALQMEVEVLNQLNHRNIVELREVYDTSKVFYMVMEEMVGGELFDRIVAKEHYSELEAQAVVRSIVDALAYCHDLGIVHRDLKPENLLYASQEEDADIKIADFGLAKLINEGQFMETACGTPGYVAPEVLKQEPYTAAVDMWSVGVITYILLCGFPPFYDQNNAALFQQIKSGAYDYPEPYWDDVSEGAKDLIDRLLVVEPQNRLTPRQVLEHPWIAGEVSGESLNSAAAELKKFNARRKFKAGIMLARAAVKMRRK